jgi:hypothetical protein
MPHTYLNIIRNYYPNANYSEVLGKELIEYLAEQGFDPGQIMLANSICSDDINAMQFPHSVKGLLGPFFLGGLNGFPFTGLTGVQAFAHHMPDDGGLLIFYAPHIGISIHDHPKGKPGWVRRNGQHHDSTCCGAAMAAIEKIKGDITLYPGITELDYQEDTIVRLFYDHKEKILNAGYPIMAATDVMLKAIEERINLLIETSYKEFSGKYLLLVGGIFINVDEVEGAQSCVAFSKIETINLHTKERKNHLPQFTGWFNKKMAR